jgi:uncharacterized alpha/beta hydrolase family protein
VCSLSQQRNHNKRVRYKIHFTEKTMKLTLKILKIAFFSIAFLAIIVVLLFGYKDIPLEELKAKYAPKPSAFVSVDGMDVHFRDEGNLADSIPIVLIHGTGASLHTFEDWTAQLKNEY